MNLERKQTANRQHSWSLLYILIHCLALCILPGPQFLPLIMLCKHELPFWYGSTGRVESTLTFIFVSVNKFFPAQHPMRIPMHPPLKNNKTLSTFSFKQAITRVDHLRKDGRRAIPGSSPPPLCKRTSRDLIGIRPYGCFPMVGPARVSLEIVCKPSASSC